MLNAAAGAAAIADNVINHLHTKSPIVWPNCFSSSHFKKDECFIVIASSSLFCIGRIAFLSFFSKLVIKTEDLSNVRRDAFFFLKKNKSFMHTMHRIQDAHKRCVCANFR